MTPGTDPEAVGPRPVRLLIVEDHELLASTLAVALRQRGLEVVTVGPSAEAAVESGRRVAPALVLLDLDLGSSRGSGLDLIRPLMEAGNRVVMMTGVTDPSRLAECVEAGAIGVLNKTLGFGQLVESIEHAMDGEVLVGRNERQEMLAHLRSDRQAERERLAPFKALAPREQAVLARIMAGDTAETIAAASYVSLATVRTQIRAILLKLGVNSQLAAVVMARDARWTPDRPQ